MVDVGSVTEEAKLIVKQAAQIYTYHLGPSFVGLVVFGSAVKGDHVPGSSDIDFFLYVSNGFLSKHGTIPLDLGAKIHRDLSRIELGYFAYIQCHLISESHQKPFVGPVPGAYQLVAGELPAREATSEELYQNAARYLNELNPDLPFITNGLIGHGRITRTVRLLCNYVWPALYNALVLDGIDGIKVWNMTKQQAIDASETLGSIADQIKVFHRAVLRFYPEQNSADDAVEVIRSGSHFLTSVKAWWIDREEGS